MKASNRLSVGELLLEGDLTARRLLLDPDALDAAAMVRTWPEVVQAGHEFLAILPRRGGGPGVHAMAAARSQDQTGERLQLMATSMHQHFANRSWPGDGPPDDQLLNIAGNLIRAHDMIASHRRPAPLLTPAVLATPPSPASSEHSETRGYSLYHSHPPGCNSLFSSEYCGTRWLRPDGARTSFSIRRLRASRAEYVGYQQYVGLAPMGIQFAVFERVQRNRSST